MRDGDRPSRGNDLDEATRAAILAARARTARTIAQWRKSDAFRAAAAAFADCADADCPADHGVASAAAIRSGAVRPRGDRASRRADAAERAAIGAETLLADGSWAEALLAPLLDALADDPFFEPPFKVHRDALRVGAVLFDCPAASIAASVASAAAMATLPPPRTIVFTGRISVTRTIRAGGARIERWRAEPMSATFRADNAAACTPLESIALRDGAVHRTDGRHEARLVCDAARDVVTLTATIRAGAAPLLREYDRASGALIRMGDADDRPSRTGMLLQLLRVAQRPDAVSCFADATHAPHFHLRWAAMREWLALDAATALPRLAAMARDDPNREIRTASRQMLPRVEQRLAEARCLG